MMVNRDAGAREELAKLTPGLRAFARALVEDHAVDVADEVVQAALLTGLADAHERRGLRLRMFMLTSVLAAHRRMLRTSAADRQAGAQNKTAQHGGVRTGQWEQLRRSRDRETAMLDDMPLEWRETLLLVVLERLSYVQTAECLGTTLNTVIGHLARARDHLSRTPAGVALRATQPPRTVPYLRIVK